MRRFVLIIAFTLLCISTFGRAAYIVEGNDVIVDLDGFGVKSNILKVEVWSENMVRIVTSMNDDFIEADFSLFTRDENEIRFRTSHVQNDIEIVTNAMIVRVAENGLVRIMTRKGRRLFVESDRSFSSIENMPNTYKVQQSLFLQRNETIFGLGQNPDKKAFNLRGQSFELKQTENSIYSPILYSDKNYALIWDNFSTTTFSDAPGGLTFTSEIADEISFFFIVGETWDVVTNQIIKYSGNTQLLPQWAYGHIANTTGCSSQQELRETINKLNTENIKIESQLANISVYEKEKEYENNASGIFKNIYAYKQLQSDFNNLNQNPGLNRPVMVTEINVPGIQQHGTFTSISQLTSTWNNFQKEVSYGITASLYGQAFWSSVPGGIARDNNINDESYRELLARWYQFSAFNPIFQSPSCDPGNWLFNESNPEALAIKKAINQRYALMPYIYSLAANSALNNEVMTRSLISEFQHDEKVFEINNQYLFGKSLMVCPVTTQGTKSRKVYLPSKSKWFDFYTGESYNGSKTIDTKADIQTIPLFIREGSIIPLLVKHENEKEDLADEIIEIRVYPGEDCSFTLYNDKGDGMGYKNGEYSKIIFDYTERRKTLTINSLEGSFEGMPASQMFKVVYMHDDEEVSENIQIAEYSGRRVRIRF